jgi:hypothetical protein
MVVDEPKLSTPPATAAGTGPGAYAPGSGRSAE